MNLLLSLKSKMRGQYLRIFFLLFFSVFSSSLALAEVKIPALTGPVVDEVGLLDSSSQSFLENFLQNVKAKTGTQISVLIVRNTQGLEIEDFSIRVVDQWKLGSAKEDKGALLLISQETRRLRIEVGQGLEGNLTDFKSKEIIETILTPAFRKGQFSKGIIDSVVSMVQISEPEINLEEFLSADYLSSRRNVSGGGDRQKDIILLILLIMGFLFFMGLFARHGGGGGGFMGPGGFGGGGWSGGSGGFGGSSGGGWSGGGGGFSGGGASGGW